MAERRFELIAIQWTDGGIPEKPVLFTRRDLATSWWNEAVAKCSAEHQLVDDGCDDFEAESSASQDVKCQ